MTFQLLLDTVPESREDTHMMHYDYLSMEQIDILLECYYLRKYTKVSDAEGIPVSKVKQIRENALRSIRLAYSKSHMQGLPFSGEAVLLHMAERSGIGAEELSNIFNGFIAERLASGNRKYWERIRKKGDVPTPSELLDFLYDKFEVDIEGFI